MRPQAEIDAEEDVRKGELADDEVTLIFRALVNVLNDKLPANKQITKAELVAEVKRLRE